MRKKGKETEKKKLKDLIWVCDVVFRIRDKPPSSSIHLINTGSLERQWKFSWTFFINSHTSLYLFTDTVRALSILQAGTGLIPERSFLHNIPPFHL